MDSLLISIVISMIALVHGQGAATKIEAPTIVLGGEPLDVSCTFVASSGGVLHRCDATGGACSAVVSSTAVTIVTSGSESVYKFTENNETAVFECREPAGAGKANQSVTVVNLTKLNGLITPNLKDRKEDRFPPPAEESVSFSCQMSTAAGVPNMNLDVYRNGVKLTAEGRVSLDPKDGNLTVTYKGPTTDDIGEYECVVQDGDNRVNASVFIDASPFGKQPSRAENKMQGDDAKIKCYVVGYPTPTVNWTLRADEDEHSGYVSVSDRHTMEPLDGIVNALLNIKDLEYEDAGFYDCEATNVVGTDTIHQRLRVRDKLAALWPFLGIVAEVVILCTIIFICEKRRARKAAQADEDRNGADVKPTRSDGAGEVRQRK